MKKTKCAKVVLNSAASSASSASHCCGFTFKRFGRFYWTFMHTYDSLSATQRNLGPYFFFFSACCLAVGCAALIRFSLSQLNATLKLE